MKPAIKDKRTLRYALVVGAVFALSAFALATCIGAYTVFANRSQAVYMGATAAMVVLAFCVGALVFYMFATRISSWHTRLATANPLPKFALAWNRRAVLLAALLMFVLWLPYTIVQYPTPFYYDTVTQLYQWQTSTPTFYDNLSTFYDVSYIDHHPVFDTLLYGSFLSLGEVLGSQNAGLFILAVLHSMACAVAISASVCYLEHLGVPKPVRLALWLFMALFSPVPLWACTLVKDVTNIPLYLAFFIMYIEAFRTRGASLANWRSVALFLLLIIFGILTKKTMLYVLVPALVVLLVWCKKLAWKQIGGVALGAVVVCQVLIPAFVWPAIGGVYPGGTQESLGIAMQQFALVVKEAGDLSEEERAAAEAVFNVSLAVEGYERGTTDHVKNCAYPQAGASEYSSFLKAWFTVGLRHPMLYTRAVLSVNAGFFCPGLPMHNYWNHEPSNWWKKNFTEADVNGELHLDCARPEALRPANDALHTTFDAFFDSPVGVALFGRGMFSGWIPLLCMFLCFFADKRSLVAWVPVILIMGTLLIGPTDQPRYLLPLLFGLPLMWGITWYNFIPNVKETHG